MANRSHAYRNAIKIRLGLARLVLAAATLAGAISPGLVAFAQDDTEAPVVSLPPPPGVDQLPGVMLLASTRAATEDGPVVSERPDYYRLYRYVPASAALRQVHF